MQISSEQSLTVMKKQKKYLGYIMSLQSEGQRPAATLSETGDKTVSPTEARNRRRRSQKRKRKAETTEDASRPTAEGRRTEAAANRPRNAVSNKKHTSSSAKSAPDVRKRDPQRNSFRRGVYSAIDLGTNNCRLLIARPTQNGFRVIDAFSRIVRLGEGVSTNNTLSQAAMDRTIEALKVCAEKIARRGVTCMRHVATEACRVADNSAEFVGRVKAETGINLDVISAGEEARLAVMGCQSLIAPGNRNALVFDIGGGSTELIWVRVNRSQTTEISGWMSIPWGVVNLSEKFGQAGATVAETHYQQMVSTVSGHLQSFEDAHRISEVVDHKRTQFLGTSGTVTTLASLHLKLPRYVRERVDGAWMKTHDIHQLSRQVARMSHAERRAQPCIGNERADLVVAGCAILEAILGTWQVPSLRVADRGIREGILRGLMQTEDPPLRADRRSKQRKQ